LEAEALCRLIPGGLELDLFGGHACVGAVPFTMEGVSPHLVPDVPGLHRFPELNLRTYAKDGGKPSVWFFSLDAGQRLAVRVARRFFHLPYFAGVSLGRRFWKAREPSMPSPSSP
jgi:uncharacterized protein YqjF (DUF2071 family)